MYTLTAPVMPSLRSAILTLEDKMRAFPQVEMPPSHFFAPGLYAREIFIPKGTLATGKIHRTGHINILSRGRVEVVTEDGIEIMTAPYTFVSKAGTKKVVHALEDSVWTTIHASDETDVERLETELTLPDDGIIKIGGVQ